MFIDLVNPEYIQIGWSRQYEIILNAHADVRIHLWNIRVVEALYEAVKQATRDVADIAVRALSKELRKNLEKSPRPPHGRIPPTRLKIDYPRETRVSGVVAINKPASIRVNDGGAIQLGDDTVMFVRNVAAGQTLLRLLHFILEEGRERRERRNLEIMTQQDIHRERNHD